MASSRLLGWTVAVGLLGGGPAAAQECPTFPCWDRPAKPQDLDYAIIAEPGLGLSLTYPSRVFSQVPSIGPDAPLLKFQSLDRRSSFTLSGVPNSERIDTATLMRWAEDSLAAAEARITYRRITDRWFVLSGYLGDLIFYQKVILTNQDRTIGVFEIKFPMEQKPFYYAIVEKMSWSFVPQGLTPE